MFTIPGPLGELLIILERKGTGSMILPSEIHMWD